VFGKSASVSLISRSDSPGTCAILLVMNAKNHVLMGWNFVG
jgi:hypothetical protein